MIYVDDIVYWPGDVAPQAQKFGRKWCHLWCDPGEEEHLHDFAKRIGLKREYYQMHKVVNHYDLVPSKRELAIFRGAHPLQMIEWLNRRDRAGKRKKLTNEEIEDGLEQGKLLKVETKFGTVRIGKGADSLERFLSGGPRGEAAQDSCERDFFADVCNNDD